MNKNQEQQELEYKEKIETLENKIEKMMSKQQTTINQKLEEHIKNIELDRENLNNQILRQNSKIKKLEEEIENSKKITTNTHYNCQPFITKLDKSSPGILQRLKNNEKSPFDHLFIPSQSSNDIYNVIDPNTNDRFCILDIGKFIEIELEESIIITGIKLFSFIEFFPNSFDIEIDDKKVLNIKEAKELNGQNREMTINIESIPCRKISIINRGQNWDKGSKYCYFKRIELLSNDSRYSRGVFSTLVSQRENHDPHRCPVHISASDFDLNTFHLIDSSKNIGTLNKENLWFQIEFPYGKVIIYGFRLKRCYPDQLKKYKIICTNESFKSLEEWTTLIEIEEKSKTEHENLDIYEFSQPSPPIKFVRLIQTGTNWENENYLVFDHFDLFGSFYPG